MKRAKAELSRAERELRAARVQVREGGEALGTLQRELKAGFAQVLWGDERRYQIYIKGDRQILRALEFFAAADELVARRRMENRDRN